jgi:hypothetical protein
MRRLSEGPARCAALGSREWCRGPYSGGCRGYVSGSCQWAARRREQQQAAVAWVTGKPKCRPPGEVQLVNCVCLTTRCTRRRPEHSS